MYSYISKGFTIGHVLARKLLRTLTCIPGVLIDLTVAIFWTPRYSSYWENKLAYSDGVEGGVAQVLFGWIGEIAGYAIGSVVGIAAGLAIYFPDLILRGAFWLHKKATNGLDSFATMVGEREFFFDTAIHKPEDYLSKAWNISMATIGTVVGGTMAVIPKVLEFIFPMMGNSLSRAAWNFGAFSGGVVGGAAAIVLFPVKYAADRLADGFKMLHRGMRSLSAFIYAKGDQDLYDNRSNDCVPSQAVHSSKFRTEYNHFKRTSTTQILFGVKYVRAEEKPKPAPVEVKKAAPTVTTSVPAGNTSTQQVSRSNTSSIYPPLPSAEPPASSAQASDLLVFVK